MRPERVAAVLLAAGLSTRFGEEDKLVAPYRGKPVVAHALENLASIAFGHLIAVVRPKEHSPEIHRRLERRGYTLVVNEEPDEGLSGSIVKAIWHVTDLRCQGALICLGDMPNVPQSHLMNLCDTAVDRRSVVASTDGLVPSPPALFGRSHFGELLALRGDQGARALLMRGIQVETAFSSLYDIDTPEDLEGA